MKEFTFQTYRNPFFFVKYKSSENQFYTFADETTPRWLTSTVLIDYDTIGGGDKFGNFFISRLPSQISDEVEEDPTGSKFKFDQKNMNGAAHKLQPLINFHVGDIITSIQKTSLSSFGSEVLIYCTINGSIGIFLPIGSKEDVDFISHLEMFLRQENISLCGRDHLSYRSSFFPVKNVLDGDLCEQFSTLPYEKQKSIATDLGDKTPSQILKKLESLRNKVL